VVETAAGSSDDVRPGPREIAVGPENQERVTENAESAALCPVCREPNACAMVALGAEGVQTCWCVLESFPPELLASAEANACICARCRERASKG